MLIEVTGDLVKDKEYTVFCHQTNCKGVMGAGIALQIKNAYPEVAEAGNRYYRRWVYGSGEPILGTNLYVKTHDERTCVNMYAQLDYGRRGQKTNYTAFQECLDRLAKKLNMSDPAIKVAFPKGIGCGLAGGEWNIVFAMIQSFAMNIPQNVYIVTKIDKQKNNTTTVRPLLVRNKDKEEKHHEEGKC